MIPSTLAIDSAFGALSVAVASARGTMSRIRADGRAAEDLGPMVRDILAEAGLHGHRPQRVAVTLGPGGFTSLRAGLALAKGLAMGWGVPLLGFTTLFALAADARREATENKPIVAAIDAKRGEVFVAIFGPDLGVLVEPLVTPVQDLAAALRARVAIESIQTIAGTGAGMVVEALRPLGLTAQVCSPGEAGLALPLVNLAAKADPAAFPANAVYLRQADARPMAPTQ